MDLTAEPLCVFCGTHRPMSREHIYPRWVREGLRATGRTRIYVGDRLAYTKTGLSHILRRQVCQSCNSGWMASALERPLREMLLPAMLGEPIVLTRAARTLAAAWAVKMSLLLALKQRELGGRTYVPDAAFRSLYDQRAAPAPPPGTQVWIAAVADVLTVPNALPAWQHTAFAPYPGDPEYYLCTFTAGHLVFQVAGQDFRQSDDRARSGKPLVTFFRPDWLLPYVRLIWPTPIELVSWPPDARFRRTDLPRLAEWEGTGTARLINVTDIAQVE